MLEELIIRKTLRVPVVTGPVGDGAAVARQLDAALLRVGFTASAELLEHLSQLAPPNAMDRAVRVINAVRELVGDHVKHNPYFIDFPNNVPDTMDFWVSCLRDVVGGVGEGDGNAHASKSVVDERWRSVLSNGALNLLALPRYGRYQHTYEDLLAVHDELIAASGDRVTVLHLGDTLGAETQALYLSLAGSPTPLGEADRKLLTDLAPLCLDGDQPETIPVRENRAVINSARLAAGRPLIGIDTVIDVLRLASEASGGDATLRTPARFRSFRRSERRTLLAALNQVAASRAKLADVPVYARRWQRLGERLHPHEYDQFPHAQQVFAVARGEETVRSLAARVDAAFAAGNVGTAVRLLATAPGMLVRRLDQALRIASPHEADEVASVLSGVVERVSGRVLCSLREHLSNRGAPDPARVFVNRRGRAWTVADQRPPLNPSVVAKVVEVLDAELARRLPASDRLVVDPNVLDLALPLSGKASEEGFAVMPRGSVTTVRGELLRFFTYWRQASRTTDFDLSALLLDDDFNYAGHVSWTNYHDDGVYFSGDLVEAPEGATEFIDVPTAAVTARHVVPQVNVYSGEGFNEVAESMFGFMVRDLAQRGMPFEPSTVRSRSAMRGTGRVALPVMFTRGEDDTWRATWLHLYLRGVSWANRTEINRVTTGMLVRAIYQRDYLTVRYLVSMLRDKAGDYREYQPDMELTEPVTFIGMARPEGLPDDSTVITLPQLNELIPK